MMDVYQTILSNIKNGKKMLAVLLDPDKCIDDIRKKIFEELSKSQPDFIFIGGSKTSRCTNELLQSLENISIPKILFPGDASQFTPNADALLFLSLISGRNADYIIGQHVTSAREIKESKIEVIPTAYILIDGGKDTSVKKISNTTPIPSNDVPLCVSTAVAGELLGLKMTYLEAGSGAKNPVPEEIIRAVKNEISHPLIVGGGIKTLQQLQNAFSSGADLCVVGNLFETHPEKISEFVDFVKK
ncbi:Geranylgeranylglyceryl phosphate synthase [uncultured Paludibacter sp.]|uniref:Geranylgeranylglyceryl phosphate synthase n=1 Tax=uncultured Paludibacter sp. TaxID=497635 RepID=A0A653AJK6_9BACT|nr:Geranylgeranylglyceryl phosphate synthase [uncultured Paludibacter sp.]